MSEGRGGKGSSEARYQGEVKRGAGTYHSPEDAWRRSAPGRLYCCWHRPVSRALPHAGKGGLETYLALIGVVLKGIVEVAAKRPTSAGKMGDRIKNSEQHARAEAQHEWRRAHVAWVKVLRGRAWSHLWQSWP